MMNLEEIKNKYKIVEISKLKSGFSVDEKFILTNEQNEKFLLRLTDASDLKKKEIQYEMLKRIGKLDIPCTKLIEYDRFYDGRIFAITTWVEGELAADIIKNSTNFDAYNYGIQAGKILKKIHSVDISDLVENPWYDLYIKKVERKINNLKNCDKKLKYENMLCDYISKNKELVKNRKLVLGHGDYHVSNMIIYKNELRIIDFDRVGIADSYDDFKPFCWSVFANEYFETGLINGYFDNQIPNDFFKILSLYTAESIISLFPWAYSIGPEEVKTMEKVVESDMKWFDNFKNFVPSWYKGIPNFDKND